MQKDKDYLETLFKKYQEGLVTEQEKELIAHWLIHLDISEKELSQQELSLKEDFSAKHLQQHFFPVGLTPAKITRFPFWMRSAAAAIFLVMGAGALFNVLNRKAIVPPIAFTEVAAHTGEIKIITLTDGTKVTLNNESRLKYPSIFAGKTREVSLVGQAFFNVAHNAEKPFKVHTAELNVQVLGTSFDVKAYPDEEGASVSVATGKVGVMAAKEKDTNTYMLLPGEALTYTLATGKFKRKAIDLANTSAWKQGLLVFDNEKLENITLRLQKAYKVKFVFKSKTLLKKELSLKIKNENLNLVMKALSIPGEFKYKIENGTVTLW